SIVPGGSPGALPVNITIDAGAPTGPRAVTVTAAAGTFTAQNLFSVLPASTVPVSTAPLPIPEVEQGGIRTGYIILTPDPGSAVPAAGVTFGIVNNAVVISQGGILPTALTTDAVVSLDVLRSASRNLGLAIAN